MDEDETANVAEGYAVLTRALGTIGAHNNSDHDLAKVIVEGEMKIRALLAFAIRKLAEPQ